ncbi:MAG: hypothetical protein WCU00_08480 [Candidatus Latescibacterota bacterium]
MKTLLERYSDSLLSGLDTIPKKMDLIVKAGKALAEAKLAGGRLLVYDRNYSLSYDCWTRGSGLYSITVYRRIEKAFKDGDALILASYHEGAPDDLIVARELRAKKNTRLVTISPHAGKNKSGELIHTLADVAIDNGCDESAGAFDIAGVKGKVLPTAREINFTINWSVQCEYIQEMIDHGCPPTLFYLVHFPYFKEMDAVMKKRAEKYGY